MSPVIAALLKTTYTVTDMHRRLRVMQEVLESMLYEEQQPQLRMLEPAKRRAQLLKEKASPHDTEVLMNLEEVLWQGFTPATLTTKMNIILKESELLPMMTLYVPVTFTDKQLAPISEWVRGNVANSILFDVHVDPKVVGGCAFVYKDRHFDWSLRRYLRSKRGMVTSLLNAYGD